MSQTLRVELGKRSYEIVVGERLLAHAGRHILPHLKRKAVIVISDEQVARLYLHRLTNSLEESGISSRSVILPAGESSKSLPVFGELLERLLEQRPDRQTMLVALGGGVIGDLTGFAASVLLRGVDFIQIPTTLLAQVDSSVGGKTGINSQYGKNLIGSFHQPKLVLADTAALNTLPPRELRAGYAEVLKYGLIRDTEFFGWLEQTGEALLAGDAAARIHAVSKSCAAKSAIVAADEHEQGERALLNFGHTFGHALEAETGFSDTLLHGEAVAIGMILAMRLSVRLGLCPQADLERTCAHYARIGLPASPLDIRPDWNIDAIMEHFGRDKKARGGRPTFILARGIGQAFITDEVPEDGLRAELAAVLSAA